MIKEILYKYLGTNGTILTPVHLEDIYCVRYIRLIADDKKRLTKDGVDFCQTVVIPEREEEEWREVDAPNLF